MHARSNLVVQIAPESEEYQQNEACIEQVTCSARKPRSNRCASCRRTQLFPITMTTRFEEVAVLRDIAQLDLGAQRPLPVRGT